MYEMKQALHRTCMATVIYSAVASLILSGALVSVVPATAAEFAIEEVVVTATKREEALSDVPQTVRALDSAFLEDSGVSNMLQISEYIPALQINYNVNPFTTNVRLRSLGTGGNEPSLEPSVGVFIDGVYQSRSGLGVADLLDVERIEVLYGPQGTLYGRNTNAGVLNVVTKRPSDTFQVDMEGQFGNYDAINISGSVSGPITDTLRYRLAGRVNQRDGWIDNNLLDVDLHDIDDSVVRGQLEWDLTDMFSVRLIYAHIERDQNCCSPDVAHDVLASGVPLATLTDLANGTGAVGALLPTLAGQIPDIVPIVTGELSEGKDYEVSLDRKDHFEQDSDSFSLLLDWELEALSLHAVTSYDTYEWQNLQDCDRSPASVCLVNDFQEGETFTQELRLASPGDEFIDWQVGLYYYSNELDRGLGKPFAILGDTARAWLGVAFLNHPLYGLNGSIALGNEAVYAGLIGASATPGDFYGRDHTWKTDAWSVFGQTAINFSDALSLTIGLRYNDEQKKAELNTFFGNINDPGATAGAMIGLFAKPQADKYDLDETTWSGMISLKAQVSDDIMLYVTAANGFKSGGFNGAPGSGLNSDVVYDPEESMMFEVGAKTTLWDGRAQINVAVYDTKLTDWQAISFDGDSGSFLVNNAGEKSVRGVDLDATLLLTEHLKLIAATAYLDAKFDEFKVAQCEPGDPLQIPAAPVGLCDFTGETPWDSPQWRNSLILVYERNIALGEFYVQPEYSYTDETNVSSKLGVFSDERYELFNLRVGLRAESWEAVLWCNNLMDETAAAVASDAPTLGRGRTYYMMPPRMYGATLRYQL